MPTGYEKKKRRLTPGQTEASGAFQLQESELGVYLLLRRGGGEKQIKNTERDSLGSKKEKKKLLTRPGSLSGGANW